ncbi:hypothetical protein EVX74_011315 [Acinetobacter lwoffii]|uniref:OLD protein-like TOPRIM domain-containing protein n=1 Tax=Acinetobacter lwoffii TaxID=28090 RepID=A0AAJ4P3K5_ACILW|nr:hypothetical protein EVX74_011315 [Acinetobacter lwoffii]
MVEGDAEYIIFEEFFKILTGYTPEKFNIHIISVGGLSFKRYLEIAKLLSIKTVVITDNDSDHQKNVISKYSEYNESNIKVFSEENPDLYTFEVCLYEDNKDILDSLINQHGKIDCVKNHMLSNKSSSALKILNALNSDNEFKGKFTIPQYIKEAIGWISE